MAGVVCSFVWIFLRAAAPCTGGQAGWADPSCRDGCSMGSEEPQHPASVLGFENLGLCFLVPFVCLLGWGGSPGVGLVLGFFVGFFGCF